MLDINTVTLSGKIHRIGVNPTRTAYPVIEAKLSVCVGHTDVEGDLYDEFNIRSYGKKSVALSMVEEGTDIVVQGRLKEDIRVNAENPNTTRSKVYINIDNFKIK